MTLTQVAVLLIRLISISLFIDAIVILTELPVMIFEIHKSQFENITSERVFALGALLVRLLIYVGAGICFLIFARPLARLFTKGLDDK
jgi:hypothetical protein